MNVIMFKLFILIFIVLGNPYIFIFLLEDISDLSSTCNIDDILNIKKKTFYYFELFFLCFNEFILKKLNQYDMFVLTLLNCQIY